MPRTKSLLASTAFAAAAAACIIAASPTASAYPNAGLPGPQLQAAFKSAAAAGTAVHVKAAFKESGKPDTVDMTLDKNGQAQGTVTQNGAAIPIKKVNGVTYVQLTTAFLTQEAKADASITPDVIKAIENKWVSSQSAIGQSIASNFAGLTDYTAFTTALASGGTASPSVSLATSGTASASPSNSAGVTLSNLTAEGTAELNGQPVAVYKNSNGTTAYFAASGPAYLEKAVATGAESGVATFTWNQPVTVTAPSASDIFSG